MEQLARVHTDKRIRIERRLVENAREHLGDEEVLAVFRGQTFLSPVILPLIGFLLFMLVKFRAVIVTDKSVVTVQQSLWSQSTVVGLVSRHVCGSVPMELTRWGLKIGDDDTIFAMPTTLAEMKEAARLAERSVV
jgi:hypothetical protein